jgi:hypothetical protein
MMVPIGQSRYTNEVCRWWGKKENEVYKARVDNAIKGKERNN